MPRIAWLRFHSSSVVSSIGALDATPALETTTSTPPNASMAAAKACSTASSEVTSPPTPMPRSPSSATAAVAPSSSRSKPTMQAPAPRQRVDDRAADAARRAGHERHLALQLAGRRRERELVELQRPVLDGEALLLGQRHEAAERVRARHHLDRAVVEVARQPRRLGGGAGADQADVLDQDDARVGVAGLGALVGVALDVGAVLVAVGGGALADPLRERVRVVGRRVEGDPQRHALGVHEVVRAGGADVGERLRVARADELEHARRGVDDEHLRLLAGDRAAQRGQHRPQEIGGRRRPASCRRSGPSPRCAR